MKKCDICEKDAKLTKNCKNIYGKTCGNKDCIKKLTHNTNLEKYGHISNLHGKDKEKNLEKLQEKYGENITNISQLNFVKEKKKETCLKNHGVEHPMQSKQILEKSKETCLEKYGVDNIRKSKYYKEKMQSFWSEIDLLTNKTNRELSSDVRRDTMLKKYGVEYLFQHEEFKKNMREHFIKNYGVDNIRKSKYYKDLMIKKGIWLSEEEKTEKEKYLTNVARYTNQNYHKYFDLLCSVYVRGIDYHLDHIYSVYDGFKNKIDPKIIGSIVNLQILPAKINGKKNKKSWISLNELTKLYNKLENKLEI